MNCPVCGKEMEPGALNTLATWDFFLPAGAPIPKWHLTKHIEGRGGIVFQDVYTSPKDAGSWERSAWVCRDCKKIVMEYW